MARRVLPVALLLLVAVVAAAQEKKKPASIYKHGPDSAPQDGVPRGTVTKMPQWKSEVFEGTVRDWWVYVPAQAKAGEACAVMVFQDGDGYQNPKREHRAPVVFDNLIHKKEMPVTVAVFVNPGYFPGDENNRAAKSKQRSIEYDTLSSKYATFLEKEILPEVAKKQALTTDPEMRAIGGISSGGICAWTVAWERPDLFRKVLSHVGSFTNIRGGDVYPGKIRKTPKKPIRAFLQAGKKDLDNEHGSWPLGNLQMEAALKFKKYDHKFVMGEEGHNGHHGGAILPDSMRWLWRPSGDR